MRQLSETITCDCCLRGQIHIRSEVPPIQVGSEPAGLFECWLLVGNRYICPDCAYTLGRLAALGIIHTKPHLQALLKADWGMEKPIRRYWDIAKLMDVNSANLHLIRLLPERGD